MKIITIENLAERLSAVEKALKIQTKVEPKEITERILTFKDACESLDITDHSDAFRLLGLNRKIGAETHIRECDDISLKLMIICLALNEGKMVDLSKITGYAPWFDLTKKPGSGFGYSVYYRWSRYSAVSSRLVLSSSKLAEFAGKQFEKEFHEYITI